MLLPIIALVIGILVLVWSADRFVDGASGLAVRLGMPQLLIGMVIVGFGTSMPELTVSAIASLDGDPGIALGNAFGSNIANIGLILGVSALVAPVAFARSALTREMPILTAVSLLSFWVLRDNEFSRWDALLFFAVFALWLGHDIFRAVRGRDAAKEAEETQGAKQMPLGKSILLLAVGLAGLVASSRALVWGAVEVAGFFHVSDLVIGLTVIAVGTSLPELASSVVAAHKGADDIALGNVIGSNIFNTLAVVGLAGAIRPIPADPVVYSRDLPVMLAMTVSLFFFGFNYRKSGDGRIGRAAAVVLLLAYVGYTVYLVRTACA